MKCVGLIKLQPPTVFFVNTIHTFFPFSLVVIEDAPKRTDSSTVLKQLIDTVRLYGPLEAFTAVWDNIGHLLGRFTDRQRLPSYERIFGNDWQTLNPDIPILKVDSINQQSVKDRLIHENPDVLIDHGTSIVKPFILETAPLALNLHWGLSPYYRGTHCTEWALINWDPYNIGVTIHKLTAQIDGGEIIAQRRATVTQDTTSAEIDMELTRLGTQALLDILDALSCGRQVPTSRQHDTHGHLCLDRQWSRHLRKQIRYIERNRLIGRMLKNPSRKNRLPIVEFPGK